MQSDAKVKESAFLRQCSLVRFGTALSVGCIFTVPARTIKASARTTAAQLESHIQRLLLFGVWSHRGIHLTLRVGDVHITG